MERYKTDSETVMTSIGIFFYVYYCYSCFMRFFRGFPIAFLYFIRYNIKVSLFIFKSKAEMRAIGYAGERALRDGAS